MSADEKITSESKKRELVVEVLDEVFEPQEESFAIDERILIKKRRTARIVDINMVRVFFTVFFAMFIIALIPTMRPSYSEAEKRELTKFPKLTVASLSSGSFFDDINLWFADTFPFRDYLVSLNGRMNDLFGWNTVQIHGDVTEGDAIPEIEDAPESQPSETPDDQEVTENQEETDKAPDQTESGSQNAETPPPPQIQTPAVEKLGALLLIDNAAYEYYNFNQAVSDQYTAYVNRAAELLAGRAQVYDMIVPTSMGITAPQNIASGANSSDQKKAIEYMYSRISPAVKTVSIYDKLYNRRNEYLYFRTDHHWTGLGAYYAYESLMTTAGRMPAPLSSFIARQFDGFLGSFYTSSGKKPQLAATPDSVIAYEPPSGNICTVYKQNGTVKTDAPIIMDGNALGQGSKYLSFIGGDNPLTVLENPNIEGGNCIVIKESFGNALVPLLTQNYRTVYVVDYRYFNIRDPRRLSQLVADTGSADVIFINNISATRSKSLVDAIGSFVG